MPNAQPLYTAGSSPQLRSTRGSTMPQPRISIQPVCEQVGQPPPPQAAQVTSTSAEGSVKGKNEGRSRTSVVGEKSRLQNASSVPFRWPKVIPSATAS